MAASHSGKLARGYSPFCSLSQTYSTNEVMSHLSRSHLPSLLPMRGPTPWPEWEPHGLRPRLGAMNFLCPLRGGQPVSPGLACAHCKPTIMVAGLHTPGSSRWHEATLSAGRQKSSFKGAWREGRSPGPKAAGAPGRQGFRVVLATQVGGGSSHNPPPGRGGGN